MGFYVMVNNLFSERLKEARLTAKLKQTELAKMSGVAAATISAYECADGNKGKNPSLDNALKLAQALNVSLDWLCGTAVSKDEVDVVDFLKMLVKLNEVNYISVDTPNLIDKKASSLLPNAHSLFTEDEYSFELQYSEAHGIPAELYLPLVGFSDRCISNFIFEWQKMKDLYDLETIDKDLYNLWLDKQFSDIQNEERKKKRKDLTARR